MKGLEKVFSLLIRWFWFVWFSSKLSNFVIIRTILDLIPPFLIYFLKSDLLDQIAKTYSFPSQQSGLVDYWTFPSNMSISGICNRSHGHYRSHGLYRMDRPVTGLGMLGTRMFWRVVLIDGLWHPDNPSNQNS